MVAKKKQPDPSLLLPQNPAEQLFRPEDWVGIADALNMTLVFPDKGSELVIACGGDRVASGVASAVKRAPQQ